MSKLSQAHVAVFGIGGVGGYCAEALARSGVGAIDLIDYDKIELTNINRQIIALHSTLGRYKADVMKERILDINKNARVNSHILFFGPETDFDLSGYDCIADAVDNISAKLELVKRAKELEIPIVSCMGAGNKLNPSLFFAGDIYESSACPLAKVMRKELRKRAVESLRVIYSKEQPSRIKNGQEPDIPLGSVCHVTATAGLMLAGEVLKLVAFENAAEQPC